MIKIYFIRDLDKDEVVYIGQTKNSLEKRFKQHKSDIKNIKKVVYLKNNNCQIELFKEVDDCDADSEEQKQIILYQTYKKLNINCVIKDKNNIISKTRKEEQLKTSLEICKNILKKMKK